MQSKLFFKLSFLFSLFVFVCHSAQAQTSVFTYQGKLTDTNAAANGQYDFTFRLFDALTGGTQIGTNAACNGVASGNADAVCDNVPVSGGIFTATLDFGVDAFADGGLRFLEISVRTGTSTGAYTTLTPLQQVTSSPFSLKSRSATFADTLSAACVLCVTDAKIQSIDGSKVTGTVANATTATNVSGIVPIANGGTGNSTQNFVDLSTNQTNIGGDKTFTGTLSGGAVNAATQYNLGGSRVFFLSGFANTNTVIGDLAGLQNPTGSFNSFFGNGTGRGTTLGENNSFFGSGAGSNNQVGNDNSFFGRNAGFSSNASENSFFGSFTGSSTNTGNRNTLIGARASLGSSNLSNATAIGAYAQATQNNSLILGSINGINGATADTNVGIGTTTPSERLHVVGNSLFTGNVTVAGNFSANGSGLTNLNGSNITSGTVSENRLGVAGMGFSGRINNLPSSSSIRWGGANGFTDAGINAGAVLILSPNRGCRAMNLSVMLVDSNGVPTPPGAFNSRDIELRAGGLTLAECTISDSATGCNSGTTAILVPAGSQLFFRVASTDGGITGDVGGTSFLFGWECR